MQIEQAIQQKKFPNEAVKAEINILYTASYFARLKTQILKPFNISIQQFNVLRILKGQNQKPASVKLVTKRMVDKTSNASRLVEKLLKKGMVKRTISSADKRKVDIIITPYGLQIAEEALEALTKMVNQSFIPLNAQQIEVLNHLLDSVRSLPQK